MAVIQVLDQSIAELIAAGEVVERPASIAKELLENAIDAGATSIVVEIENGGISLLRVSDNGIGIEREDVPRAFLRHATSKIRDAKDLDGILTLGFRGEALASIAAMSRVELVTKTADETEGTLCRMEGGSLLDIEPIGCPTGTTITVRDVFYNTPARMKFLKKNTSEASAIAQVVDKLAFSHPEIAFRLMRDGQTRLQTTGSGDLLSVIHAVYGKDLSANMIAVDYVYENKIGVHGYISSPAGVKPSRTYQNFFINGRFVRTRTAQAALEEAFKNKIMSGRFPACVLNLELDASTVDVNVHPAKTEIRFAEEKPVFSAVYFAVKTALSKLEQPVVPLANTANTLQPLEVAQAEERTAVKAAASVPTSERMTAQEFRVLFSEDNPPQPSIFNAAVELGAPSFSSSKNLDIFVDEPIATNLHSQTDALQVKKQEIEQLHLLEEKGETPLPVSSANEQTALDIEPPYRVVGEVFLTYIVLQRDNTMLLVDKHAAHERMLYEQLKQNIAYGNRQLLLTPQMVVLSRDDYAAVIENLPQLEALGFLAEDFGDNTVIVRETPIELGEQDIVFIVTELADKLKQARHDLTPDILERLYYSIACKSAVRAGDKNTLPELAEIVEQLAKNPQITHCPHGRPVSVELTRHEIEKLFGRLG